MNSAGSELLDESAAAVYPNPAKDHIILTVPRAGISAKDVRITDAAGHTYSAIIRQQAANGYLELDISKWSRGLYMITVTVNHRFETFRVVKL